eukprot:SAG11_NODE_38088_length_254_cov_0.554839_1_plen_32_part_01
MGRQDNFVQECSLECRSSAAAAAAAAAAGAAG